jgi:hypothetical protein
MKAKILAYHGFPVVLDTGDRGNRLYGNLGAHLPRHQGPIVNLITVTKVVQGILAGVRNQECLVRRSAT